MSRKVDILKRWYKDVWEDGNLDVIDNYHARPSSTVYIAPNFTIDPTEIREWAVLVQHFVTDARVEVVHTVEEGDWLSALIHIQCFGRHQRQPVEVYQQVMARFDGDVIAETYPSFDFISFFEGLGQLPKDTRALLMAGTTLQ